MPWLISVGTQWIFRHFEKRWELVSWKMILDQMFNLCLSNCPEDLLVSHHPFNLMQVSRFLQKLRIGFIGLAWFDGEKQHSARPLELHAIPGQSSRIWSQETRGLAVCQTLHWCCSVHLGSKKRNRQHCNIPTPTDILYIAVSLLPSLSLSLIKMQL